jgi:SAM-dependent methyltransferase
MKVSFVNNAHEACGVGQYGRLMLSAMERYSKNEIYSYSISNLGDFTNNINNITKADIIFFNYNTGIIPGLKEVLLSSHFTIPVIGVVHDYVYHLDDAYATLSDIFHYRVLLDPIFVSSVPNVFSSPRIVPDISLDNNLHGTQQRNNIFTVGAIGLAADADNLASVIKYVEANFDEAIIKFHFPLGHFCSKKFAIQPKLKKLTAMVAKKGISVQTSCNFMEPEELIRCFLAKNDMNICFRSNTKTGGISSRVDFYLAAERPVVFSDCNMHRHVKFYAPELFIENNPLSTILNIGMEKVRNLKAMWSPQNAAVRYDEIFEFVYNDAKKVHTTRYNTVLNDTLRKFYQEHVTEIKNLCPYEFASKYPRANVQQGFVKAKVEEFAREGYRILCVGCYADTAYLALQRKGFIIEGIDPVINRDLDEHFKYWDNTKPYDIIFSTSVIEHVEHDAVFVNKIAKMLSPGGYAILTMDFKEEQSENNSVIPGDYRFYNTNYILTQLATNIPGCILVDCYDWQSYESDFELIGYNYGFSTFVFMKKITTSQLDEFNANERKKISYMKPTFVECVDEYLKKTPGIHKIARRIYRILFSK